MIPVQLSLVIPGLLGPFPDADAPDFPVPDAPTLTSLLQTAKRSSVPLTSLETWLGTRSGIHAPDTGDWPSAPLCAAAEIPGSEKCYWFHADPVHLRADQSRLLLFGSELLNIQQQEADALAGAFNELYGTDGFELVIAASGRWYLCVPGSPALQTTPLGEVAGRDINLHLPRGEEAGHWHGIMNEIQMLFFSHPVNRTREQAGRPMINSLWLWGGGKLPVADSQSGMHLVADNLLARGLVATGHVSGERLPQEPSQWLQGAASERPCTVILDHCIKAVTHGDIQAWQVAVEALEAQWFKPLLQTVRQQRQGEISLLPLNGLSYELREGSWWQQLWQRPVILRDFL